MPAQQRTFDLVPTTLAKTNIYRPPMTSKAAKKAYAKKTSGPRISRAEQRRLDALELERQKKEFEREKAAARAKAAREKKAAKAEKEKEERKRLGIPEPSRFVRASQPTISRFVRSESNGGKRTWQEMEFVPEDSDEMAADMGAVRRDDAEPPAKRVAVVDQSEDEAEPPPKDITMVADYDGGVQAPAAKRDAVTEDSEDEFGDFPSLSQTDLLDRIDTYIPVGEDAQPRPSSPHKSSEFPMLQYQSPELPRHKVVEEEDPFDDYQILAEMATTQLLSEAAEAALKSDILEPQHLPIEREVPSMSSRPQSQNPRTQELPTIRPTVNSQYYRTPTASRQPLQNRSNNMSPPKHLQKRNISFAPPPVPAKSIHASRNLYSAVSSKSDFVPPSATQAFLEEHIDHFFPSPTQQVRELMDDIDGDDLPSNTQIANEISPPKPTNKIPQPTLPKLVQPVFEDSYFGDLFCTQDLAMSSQEVAELGSPFQPPPGAAAQKPREEEQEQEPLKAKRRFFEEKDEDVLHAVLHESKLEAERDAQQREQPEKSLVKEPQHDGTKRVHPPTSDYGDDDLFEDDEDTLLQAVLNDSKIEAERREKLLQKTTVNPPPIALREEDTGRTLKRVQSTTSDYGDDEFCGWSQELAALC